MSRLAKYPILIPSNLNSGFEGNVLTMSNGSLSLSLNIHPSVQIDNVEVDGKSAFQCIKKYGRDGRFLGTTARLISNMIEGLTKGFSTTLEIYGVGYRAKLNGRTLVVSVGKSHEEIYELPEGVEAILASSQTELELKSHDKQLLGQSVANICALRKPDSYKGKGIRKRGQQLKLKEVKKK